MQPQKNTQLTPVRNNPGTPQPGVAAPPKPAPKMPAGDPHSPTVVAPAQAVVKTATAAVQATGPLPISVVAVKNELHPENWFKSDAPQTPRPKQPAYKAWAAKLAGHNKSLVIAVVVIWVLVFGSMVYAFVSWRSGRIIKNTGGTPSTGYYSDDGSFYPYTYGSPAEQPNPENSTSEPSSPTSTGSSSPTSTGSSGGSGNTAGGSGGTPPPTGGTSQAKTHKVSYTSSCFSPATVTVNAGDTVRFANNSSKNMWPASDSHPDHDEYPGFDAGTNIAPGTTYSFTFTQKGTWGYHDHNKPGCKGTVIVQ